MFYILLLTSFLSVEGTYYDTYTGDFITQQKYDEYVRNDNEARESGPRDKVAEELMKIFGETQANFCVGELLKDCDPNEGRRVDGTCNNLKYPTRGASHSPTFRLLPAVYDTDFQPRKGKDNCDLPLERPLRKGLVQDGRVPDQKFTQLLSYAMLSFANDVIEASDTINYVIFRPDCCSPTGSTDPECVQIKIPEDDPVHQFSGIRCQNMTRPRSFQSIGCIKNDTAPVRIFRTTPGFDLSQVYGNSLDTLNKKGRLFKGGLLKYEVENGKIWPPSSKSPKNLCLLNVHPRETRCHDIPDIGGNGLLGTNLFLIWQWRHHNMVANKLGEMNRCWDDEKIFQTAKDINIAYMMQIYYYEMWAALMGYENLVYAKVLSKSKSYREMYNHNVYPQSSIEYPFALRWGHMFQDAKLKLYDKEGYHLKDVKMVNLTLRTGFLVENIEYITLGATKQASGKVEDYTVDPDMGEKALGPFQRIMDVTATDMAKNRYFGFAPYVDYKKYCTGKQYTKFEDLLDSMEPEQVELLAEIYKYVEDIDMAAGMWLEKRTYGSVPPTFYCIIVKQLLRNIISDRHWYERKYRPNAFTPEQLAEIRKASLARFLCDVGDCVTKIQPQPLFRAGPRNQIRSCDEIPKMNFDAWIDYSCYNKHDIK